MTAHFCYNYQVQVLYSKHLQELYWLCVKSYRSQDIHNCCKIHRWVNSVNVSESYQAP